MPNFSKYNFTKWLHVAFIPDCVMMLQFIIIIDDILAARYKLAQYYLREFSEISLYSSQETNKKVPFPKLYVAMKWMDYNEYASGGMEDSDEYALSGMEDSDEYASSGMEYDEYNSSKKEESGNTKLTDYTEIFKMVFGYYLYKFTFNC